MVAFWDLGVALTLIFVTIKAINPRPISILILGCHASVIHWSLPLLHNAKLWCDKDYGEVEATAADVNTSVGVGDRRFPTASFDSARNESSGYVFSLLYHYLLPLLWCTWRALSCVSSYHEAVFCDEKWVPISWEVGADQCRALLQIPKGKDWGRGGSPLVSFEQASHIKKTLDIK